MIALIALTGLSLWYVHASGHTLQKGIKDDKGNIYMIHTDERLGWVQVLLIIVLMLEITVMVKIFA